MDVLVNLELNIVGVICLIREFEAVLTVLMANQLLIVFRVIRFRVACIVVAKVAVLVVHGLILNLEEVVWVELKSSHLLFMSQVVPVVSVVAIARLGVRTIAKVHSDVLGEHCAILGLVCQHVLLTGVASPVLLLLRELLEFSVVTLLLHLETILEGNLFVVVGVLLVVVEIFFVVVVPVLFILIWYLLRARIRRRRIWLRRIGFGRLWLRLRCRLGSTSANQVVWKLDIELYVLALVVLARGHAELELVVNVKVDVVVVFTFLSGEIQPGSVGHSRGLIDGFLGCLNLRLVIVWGSSHQVVLSVLMVCWSLLIRLVVEWCPEVVIFRPIFL